MKAAMEAAIRKSRADRLKMLRHRGLAGAPTAMPLPSRSLQARPHDSAESVFIGSRFRWSGLSARAHTLKARAG
jgi:hypothetical protein